MSTGVTKYSVCLLKARIPSLGKREGPSRSLLIAAQNGCDGAPSEKHLDLASWQPVSAMAISSPQAAQAMSRAWQPRILSLCPAPTTRTDGRPWANGKGCCSPPTPPQTHYSPGTYLILIRPRSFYSLINNTTTIPTDDVVHAPPASVDKAASDTAARLQPLHLDPISVPHPTQRAPSVGTDRRVPVRQPQVSLRPFLHRRVCLASLTKAISLFLRPISPCLTAFICHFHFPRPNAARQGQSARCCDPPSPQGCISVSTPSTTQFFHMLNMSSAFRVSRPKLSWLTAFPRGDSLQAARPNHHLPPPLLLPPALIHDVHHQFNQASR